MSDGELTLWGETHVADLVRVASGQVREVLLESGGRGRYAELTSLLAESGVPWRAVPRAELESAGGRSARGVVALLKPFPYASLEDLLEPSGERSFVVAVDSVTDPGNLGAILRSAVFFGAAGALLQERRCVHVTPAVLRRSAGAVLCLPVVQVTNLARALDKLKEHGFWVYGTVPPPRASGPLRSPITNHQSSTIDHPPGPRTLCAESFPDRTCFVLGSEGSGMRRLVEERCDVLLTLPGRFESLNVGAFAAVLFFQWSDRHGSCKKNP